jgi:hypothetical protein
MKDASVSTVPVYRVDATDKGNKKRKVVDKGV